MSDKILKDEINCLKDNGDFDQNGFKYDILVKSSNLKIENDLIDLISKSSSQISDDPSEQT